MIVLIVFILIIQLIVCVYFTSTSRNKAILINLSTLSFILLYTVPFFNNYEKYYRLECLILFGSLGLLLGMVFTRIVLQKKQKLSAVHVRQNYINKLNTTCNSRFIKVSYFFLAISLLAISSSLKNLGGISEILFSAAGGADYLQARVNSPNSGLNGLLIWLAPISLSYLFIDLLTENIKKTYTRKLISFSIILFLIMTGYLLLTVRHNAITTCLMLFSVYIFISGFSKSKFLIVISIVCSIILVFQAVRVTSVDDLSVSSLMELRSDESEHLEVTSAIVSKVLENGYTGLTHIKDIFIFCIPRKFWQDKPRTSYLNRTYFPRQAFVGSEKAIGILGEGYSIYGNIGVLFLTLLFSITISIIQLKLDRIGLGLKQLLLILTILPVTYIGIRTGVFGKHLLSVLMMIFQVHIYFSVFKVVNIITKKQ